MKARYYTPITTAACCLFLLSCGGEDNSSGEKVEDCERYEVEEFEDCTYEGILDDPEYPEDEYTDHLQNIEQFCDSKCRSVEIVLVGNSSYENLEPLSGMQEIQGVLNVYQNEHLQTLGGLDNLTTFDAGGSIRFNPELENLEGLGALEEITGSDSFSIYNNGIKSMDGLESLEVVEPSLKIHDNKNLEDLRGLESLERIEGNLTIEANARLPECEIDWLVDRVEVEGNVNIDDNGFALEGDGHCE
ncbi:MAG: hypothetical protein ACOCV2_02955 [Persicimonas sp.]